MNYGSVQVNSYHSLFKTLDFHVTFLHRSLLMKNSFALSTVKCTYFTSVLAQELLVAECFVYFRLRLWTGQKPGAEELLRGGGMARPLRGCPFCYQRPKVLPRLAGRRF